MQMDLLDYFQNQQYANTDYFVHRKCQIPLAQEDINLFGVRGSGKTAF